jgi:WD40 repeat protein
MSADGNLIAASLNDHVAVLDLSHIDPGTEESGPGPATQLSLIPKLRQATFSPRGRLLAAAHDDGGWAILNAQDPTDPRTVFRNTTVRDVADFVFSEDGGRLAFMGTDRATGSRTAQVWDLSRPERPRLLHQVPSSDGNTLDLDPTGRFLAESGDGRTTLWRLP